jgi:hypothetical protein
VTLTVSVGAVHGSIEVDLPVRIVSEMNGRDHWTKVHKRSKDHHHAVFYTLVPFKKLLGMIAGSDERIVVTFTRLGPGHFDSDNLASGFKFCRDEVAKMLGINDGDERFDWRYEQVSARMHSARVRIEEEGARS